ncbi:MAG: hypothetical protein A2583_16625 [Bdellovibrionales bacterium RIFOXYD1_FULL_53_11]|nr:MAG: hypothetical protein A2583_16625 [Bdellovibrionales bacterium RIFOXYD1_FULL_53_11]
MYTRTCKPLLSNSFFLFGARGTGKTSLLKSIFSESSKNHVWLNLLDDSLYRELVAKPERFLEKIPSNFNAKSWVVLDEIQRIPGLLNYVHSLIESRKIKFALTGSSARKLKRGGANLLAGRAFLNNLHPLTHAELKEDFRLEDVLSWGTLPKVTNSESILDKQEFLKSYVGTYLRQEIKEEQIVRQLDPFVRFLETAAQHNGKIINASKIARDSLTEPHAVIRYFEILVDTLAGFFLEPFHHSARKIQTEKAKFYFFDCGIKRALENDLENPLVPGSYGFGNAFEHFFILECIRIRDYLRKPYRFSYSRTKDGVEIDLIIEKSKRELWAVEIKSSERVDETELKHARNLANDLGVKRFIVASREKQPRKPFNDLEILPWAQAIAEIFL